MKSVSFVVTHGGTKYSIAANLRDGSDKLVVLMHGLGAVKENFDGAFNVPELRGYSLCAFDWVGYGASDRPGDFSYRLEDQAEIANQVIAGLHASQVFIAGHSMGGGIGLLTARHTKDLGGFIALEGLLGGGAFSKRVAAQTQDDFVATGRQELIAGLRSNSSPSVRRWAEEFAAGDPIAEYRSSVSMVEWASSGKLFDVLNSLTRKSYIYSPDDNIDELKPRFVGVETYEVKNAGHFMMPDNPTDTYRAISGCLARWTA